MAIEITNHKLHIELDREFRRRGYDVVLGSDLLSQAGSLARHYIRSNVIIITEPVVAKHHLKKLEQSFISAGHKPNVVIANVTEKSKNFLSVKSICQRCLKIGVNRNTLIVVLGGGVIGDMASFAASILMRGLSYVACPTTLLSQVDSSIGGKTGVNLPEGKNMLGTFYQPSMVISDVSTLKTLNKSQMLAGYAEMIKHGIIEDKDLFSWLKDGIWRRILNYDERSLVTAIYRSSAIKARIVSSDEREHSRRMLLNLGHTFGHALEKLINYNPSILPHGYAVAIGIVMAAKYSVFSNSASLPIINTITSHFQEVGLPVSPQGIIPDDKLKASLFINAMRSDKKRNKDHFSLVLLHDIGRAFANQEVSKKDLEMFFNSTLGNLEK